MPGYKAIVSGENFEFVVDDEPQQLEFTREVYVDADDESAAQQAALAEVRAALLAQAMLDESSDQIISIDEISQTDVLAAKAGASEFVWFFPEHELDDED
ncbi:hypothetical protein MNBD_GAMMA21-1046 [hydrothermal vent metagenome]|uniref:Uncharacterized protein n=1 Tax=hydrothermal vent metagenome TaxID=652676 RepID=A0A3B0ZSV6_9ZZZZ